MLMGPKFTFISEVQVLALKSNDPDINIGSEAFELFFVNEVVSLHMLAYSFWINCVLFLLYFWRNHDALVLRLS
jgi:hypothetical protein